MKKVVEDLREFLEDAHKNGTNCAAAERELILARQALDTANEDEKAVLGPIIAELEQIHVLCELPTRTEDLEPECCGC